MNRPIAPLAPAMDPIAPVGRASEPSSDRGPPDPAGDAMPPGCVRIQVRLRELRQLFNEMDPSPFHERDLAPEAEEFIVEWAREAPHDAPLGLIVHIDHPSGDPNEAGVLRDAVRRYFQRRAMATRRRLRDLFGRGRVSLGIGLAFLALAGVLANAVTNLVQGSLGGLLRESLIIGGWVAMWRPLEVFLYDWWPIRAQARQFERLATMPVRLEHAPAASPTGSR